MTVGDLEQGRIPYKIGDKFITLEHDSCSEYPKGATIQVEYICDDKKIMFINLDDTEDTDSYFMAAKINIRVASKIILRRQVM